MRTKRPPLSKELQVLVEETIQLAYILAHLEWRRSCLPARYLEELKADSVLLLCECAQRYLPSKKCPFGAFVRISLTKQLLKRSLVYREQMKTIPVGDGMAEMPEQFTEGDPLFVRVLQEINDLPQSHREVIEWRYGLCGETPLMLDEVVLKVGKSRSRISEIEIEAIAILQAILRRDYVEGRD